jgi:hypothetical protein
MSKTTKPTARPSDIYANRPHVLYTREGQTYIKWVGLDDGEDPQADGWEHRGVFPTWDAAAAAV